MSILTTEELHKKADDLGIKYTSKTSDDTLIARIEASEAKTAAVEEAATEKAKPSVEKAHNVKESLALKRVSVHPLNPVEAKLTSKFICFANSIITINKAILFGKPIFLEKAVINLLKSMTYQTVLSKTDNRTTQGISNTLVPAYNVVDLPDLTEEELAEMKKNKALKDASIKD